MRWIGLVACALLVVAVYAQVARNLRAIRYNKDLRRRVMRGASGVVRLVFDESRHIVHFDGQPELIQMSYSECPTVAKMFERARLGGGWADLRFRRGRQGLVTYTFFCETGELPGSVEGHGLERDAAYT